VLFFLVGLVKIYCSKNVTRGTQLSPHPCGPTRILDDIASARQSVYGSFIAGDPTQVCQKVIWGFLKAHDAMADLAIALELVKFLAVNTSFELLEKMTTKVSVLESDVSELKKAAAGAIKAANTVGNRAQMLSRSWGRR
jgi:hypothetical protein